MRHDEENPDPRQMATLREKCANTVGRMDEPMEEVIRKLEEGMNPEELEDRMGDLWEMKMMQGRRKDGEESMQSRLKKNCLLKLLNGSATL